MQYYAIGDNGYVISHHGILGMHWGIRRFQPYGAGYDRKGGKTGTFKKAKLDRVRKKALQAAYSGDSYKSAKLMKKASKLSGETVSYEAKRIRENAQVHHTTSNEYKRYNYSLGPNVSKDRRMELQSKSDHEYAIAVRGYKAAQMAIEKYGDTPYRKQSVDEKFISKSINKTFKEMADNPVYAKKIKYDTEEYRKSYQNRSGLTNKQINEKAQKAAKTGKYDIGFVEKTQNYSTTIKGKDLDKEYREYLRDPETYWHKELYKYYKQDGD